MAGFASQAALRSKWGDIVDTGSSTIPETTDVSQGLKNVVGWLKQVLNYFIKKKNQCCKKIFFFVVCVIKRIFLLTNPNID